MILKPTTEPTPVVFREGIRGSEVESQFGGKEIRHFVNQKRDYKDTLFLPPAAQRQLETINPRNDETVLISKEKVDGKWQWYMSIAEPNQNDTKTPATPPPTQHQKQLPRPEANMLLGAYMAALDAQLALIEYATEKGVPLRFNEITMASSAHCLYIEACKQRADGRRAA